MRHLLLATVLGAAFATTLGAQLPADTARADTARADPARADPARGDTTRVLRPNPRLRPRPVAPLPRRPGASAVERLAPPAPPSAAALPVDTPPRRATRSGIKVRKEAPPDT
jgi:hypothetical protein